MTNCGIWSPIPPVLSPVRLGFEPAVLGLTFGIVTFLETGGTNPAELPWNEVELSACTIRFEYRHISSRIPHGNHLWCIMRYKSGCAYWSYCLYYTNTLTVNIGECRSVVAITLCAALFCILRTIELFHFGYFIIRLRHKVICLVRAFIWRTRTFQWHELT